MTIRPSNYRAPALAPRASAPSHTTGRLHRRAPPSSAAPPAQRPRLSAPHLAATPALSAPPSSAVPLRNIQPVRDALANLRDGCAVISTLAQTLTQRTSHVFPVDMQRAHILDFRGFPPSLKPVISPLLTLSKSDLDILAWIFVVSKHGRKEDVARRIVASLRQPLKHRVPATMRKPFIPDRISSRVTPSQSTPQHTQNTHHTNHNLHHHHHHHHLQQQQQQQQHQQQTPPLQDPFARQTLRPSFTPPSNRASMPSLAPQHASTASTRTAALSVAAANGATMRAAGGGLLGSLARQIQSSDNRAASATSAGVLANRSRQIRDMCQEMLAGYAFLAPENPFNQPLNSPLGTKRYVFFTSMQLSRGIDPSLIFTTPAPISTKKRPVVLDGDLQVHIRCLRVEIEKAKTEWKQAWPFPASCRVNGNNVPLNQAQRYTNGKLAGRDAATNITPFLRKYKSTGVNDDNRVVLRRQNSTATAAAGQYVLFAQEILVLSQESMTRSVTEGSEKYWVDYRKTLEKKGFPPTASKFEMAQQGVVQFLTDPDGLTVSSMKVSLRCPLALTRIITPVKGKRCQHVQCFDLHNFLEYTRRSSKFDCPVCNKPTAAPANLVVSPYIEHALEKYQDCDEVEIFQDGSMVAVERKQTGIASDDEEDSGGASNIPNGSASNGVKNPVASNAKVAAVVDLTLDSDDDDVTPVATPVPETAGNQSHFNDIQVTSSAQQSGQAGHDSSNSQTQDGNAISPLDQDMDFTFRSDFLPWGDSVQVADDLTGNGLRMPLPSANNARTDWTTCDVIAIDSD